MARSEAAVKAAQAAAAVDASDKPTSTTAANAEQVSAPTLAETKEAAVQAAPEITEVGAPWSLLTVISRHSK